MSVFFEFSFTNTQYKAPIKIIEVKSIPPPIKISLLTGKDLEDEGAPEDDSDEDEGAPEYDPEDVEILF